MLRTGFVTRSIAALTVFAFVAGSMSSVAAQRKRRDRSPRNVIDLVAKEKVQKELNVADEQKKQIKELTDSYRAQSLALFSELESLTSESRAKARAGIRATQNEMAAEAGEVLAEILNDSQHKRLQEILLQVLGSSALQRDDVAETLKLSKEQRANIKETVNSEQARTRQLFQDVKEGKIKRADLRKKFGNLRNEIKADAIKILTTKQQKQFEQMKGKPFQLDS